MARLASLAMYVGLPGLEVANDRLWAAIRDRLRADGIDAPEALDRDVRYDEAWTDERLLFAQTCGLPYVEHLRGKVRLVATPVYGFAGGDGPQRASMIVVAKDDPAPDLPALRGRRVAINEPGSNSGVNLLRAAVAPLARDGRFFGTVIETGDHMTSMALVAAGEADVAAIDSVTFGQTVRHRPDLVAGLRVLGQTPAGPGLPFITHGRASDAELTALRNALAGAIADPDLAPALDALGITGLALLEDADYQVLADLRDGAIHRGYPVIA